MVLKFEMIVYNKPICKRGMGSIKIKTKSHEYRKFKMDIN